MKPDLLEALRASVEAVRGQIPARELTVGSVERLLRAADAVLADAGAPRREEGGTPRPIGKPPAAGSKRQQAREKWARIARQNATETQAPLGAGSSGTPWLPGPHGVPTPERSPRGNLPDDGFSEVRASQTPSWSPPRAT